MLDVECEHCHGDGAEPGFGMKTCPTCKGAGQQTRTMNSLFGQIQQAVVCETCHGKGKVPEKECSVCRGKGTIRQNQDITIKIPAGIDDGATIRLRDRGEAVAGGSRGDLYVHIRVKAHKKFTREGNIILSEEHISMVDAALGTEIDVETVDGVITMKIPAGTQSGTDFKLSGHGVPHLHSESRGSHIVGVIVDTPTKLTKKQKELLEQFKDAKKRGLFSQYICREKILCYTEANIRGIEGMGLIFLIIVIIVVIKLIKLLQRGDSQPSNYSEDYRQGYWDGVRDAQNGCAKN